MPGIKLIFVIKGLEHNKSKRKYERCQNIRRSATKNRFRAVRLMTHTTSAILQGAILRTRLQNTARVYVSPPNAPTGDVQKFIRNVKVHKKCASVLVGFKKRTPKRTSSKISVIEMDGLRRLLSLRWKQWRRQQGRLVSFVLR